MRKTLFIDYGNSCLVPLIVSQLKAIEQDLGSLKLEYYFASMIIAQNDTYIDEKAKTVIIEKYGDEFYHSKVINEVLSEKLHDRLYNSDVEFDFNYLTLFDYVIVSDLYLFFRLQKRIELNAPKYKKQQLLVTFQKKVHLLFDLVIEPENIVSNLPLPDLTFNNLETFRKVHGYIYPYLIKLSSSEDISFLPERGSDLQQIDLKRKGERINEIFNIDSKYVFSSYVSFLTRKFFNNYLKEDVGEKNIHLKYYNEQSECCSLITSFFSDLISSQLVNESIEKWNGEIIDDIFMLPFFIRINKIVDNEIIGGAYFLFEGEDIDILESLLFEKLKIEDENNNHDLIISRSEIEAAIIENRFLALVSGNSFFERLATDEIISNNLPRRFFEDRFDTITQFNRNSEKLDYVLGFNLNDGASKLSFAFTVGYRIYWGDRFQTFDFSEIDFLNEKYRIDNFIKSLGSICLTTRKHYYQNKKIKNATLKSAIAKAMARNTSHNMGSHVLSRMVSADAIDITSIMSQDNSHYTSIKEKRRGEFKEQSIKSELDELLINEEQEFKHQWYQDEFQIIREKIVAFRHLEAQKKYYNRLISYFFSYLKTRQDFLADIVSGVPQVQSSKWFLQEVMTGLDSNPLLLNRISGVDNFYYRFKFGGLLPTQYDDQVATVEGNDLLVAMSSDIMGQHALYVILENIIRNTAKHGNHNQIGKDSTEHEFTILLEESQSDSSYYRVTVHDDISITGYGLILCREKPIHLKTYPLNSDVSQIEVLEIDEENLQTYFLHLGNELIYLGTDEQNGINYFKISKIDYLIINQNLWINKPILNLENFDLRQNALGLVEMEVCAAYLRRIPITEIQTPEYLLKFSPEEIFLEQQKVRQGKAPVRILRAIKTNWTEERASGSLGYRFYIPKPKEILIIDETGDLWNLARSKGRSDDPSYQFKELEKYGILLLNAKASYRNDQLAKWRYNKTLVYPHALMIRYNQPNNQSAIDSNTHLLPSRVINYDYLSINYNKYRQKHNTRLARGGKNWGGYSINLDLFLSPKAFIIEAWRAWTQQSIESKKLRCRLTKHARLLNDTLFEQTYNPAFDHHGGDYLNWKENWKSQSNCREIFESRFEGYVQAIEQRDSLDNLKWKFQYLDSALSNILIVDERIQEQAFKQKYKLKNSSIRLRIADIWNYAGVYIPSATELNLGQKNFSSNYKVKIKKIIDEQFGKKSNRESKGVDFIVVHLGVVEKILEQTQGKSKDRPEDIKRFLEEIAIDEYGSAKVILTSGRAPGNLPINIPFLSYSVISQYVIEYRFKLFLNEVLNAARPKITTI